MKILTKQEMYEKFHAGEFGNKTKCWKSFDEWQNTWNKKPKPGVKFALRYMEKPGGPCTYNLDRDYLVDEYYKWIKQGYQDQYIQVSEMIDDRLITLAGEVKRSEHYYDLTYYLNKPVPMREGLAKYGQTAVMWKAQDLLVTHMDDQSFINLCILFAEYPDSVIEFTCCSRSVGELGWNTVFWEVRDY